MSAEETPKQAAEELQKFYLTRHEWYEARYSVTYEVKAATYEEAVKELEKYDETGKEDNCICVVTDLDFNSDPTGELPLETDDNVIVVLKGDTAEYEERKKELPIKQTFNDVIYSEQLNLVLAYVAVGYNGELTPMWLGLGFFRNEDKAKKAVQKYADENGSLSGDEVRYFRLKEGEALPGETDLMEDWESEYDD